MGVADSELGQDISYSVRYFHGTAANKCRHTKAYAKLGPDHLLSRLAATLLTCHLAIRCMQLHTAALTLILLTWRIG
jgi:hypothetical protein